LVHCFNSGCELEEKHHSVLNFLKIIGSSLVNAYKREMFQTQIDKIKESNALEDIVGEIKKSRLELPEAPKTNEPEIPKLLLEKFHRCKDHKDCFEYVISRGITPACDWLYSTDEFFTYQDKKVYIKDYLIIPIYRHGKFKGWYSRSIKEKSFSTFLLPGTEKVWYSRNQNEETDIKNVEIFTEGIFDALSTTFRSASMLGADLSPDYVKRLKQENPGVTFVFDNDKTGVQKALKYVDDGFKVFVWPEVPYKDLNELLQKGVTKEQITKFIEQNTYGGILAKTKLKMKEV
jgi:hypothetical protein